MSDEPLTPAEQDRLDAYFCARLTSLRRRYRVRIQREAEEGVWIDRFIDEDTGWSTELIARPKEATWRTP